MSASIAQRLAQLSVESAEDRYEEAMEVAEASKEEGMESVSDMVEHAEKAEEVAEQLEELAEKAEEVADEDKAYLLNEVSTEAFSMVYANIMKTNNLQMAATSFESAQTHQEKMLGLAKDARGVVMHVRQYQDQVLDFSPEGKFLSFLRRDKALIKKSFATLLELEQNVKSLGEVVPNVELIGKNTQAAVMRDGKPVSDVSAEVIKDIQLILKSKQTIESNLSKVLQFVKSDPSSDATPPALTMPELFGEPLLGNRKVGAGDKASQTNVKSVYGETVWAKSTGVAKALRFILAVGVTGGTAIQLYFKGRGDQAAMNEAGTKINFGDIGRLTAEFRKLESILGRENPADERLKEISSNGGDDTKFKKATIKRAISQLYQQEEMLYEHALFLLNAVTSMLKHTQKKSK